MATFPNVPVVVLLLIYSRVTTATWCVARTDAAEDALQNALDYACGAGADCAPVTESGLCFLPNTVQAHASYAFNSYYMHSSMAPTACDFAGTAAIATTDPSYGSCVYPASASTAGGIRNPPLDTSLPPPQIGAPLVGSGGALMPPPDFNGTTPNGGGGALLTPIGMAPELENSPSSEASAGFPISGFLFIGMVSMAFFFMFQPMDVFVA